MDKFFPNRRQMLFIVSSTVSAIALINAIFRRQWCNKPNRRRDDDEVETTTLHKRAVGSLPWLRRTPKNFYPFAPPRGVMNLRRPAEEPYWLDVDCEYRRSLELKHVLLATSSDHVVGSVEDPLEQVAAKQVLEAIVQDLDKSYPALLIANDSHITNRATGRSWLRGETPDVLIAAQLVQEDLVVMLPQGDTFYFAFGVVCFADRWRVKEKIGLTLGEIHAPVPHYAPVTNAVDSFFKHMITCKDVRVRYNFSFARSADLHLPEDITNVRMGGDGHLRVERQAFKSLPCGGVLFTIRTYIERIDEISYSVRGALLDVLEGRGRTSLNYDPEHSDDLGKDIRRQLSGSC